MKQWNQLPDPEIINETISNLKNNGINAILVSSQNELKVKISELIPEKSEVMTMSSQTLEITGLAKELNDSGKYVSVRSLLTAKADGASFKANLPEFAVGSVQAVTQDGRVVMASATGSQLPAYVYGAKHVVWVVSTQKIVSNLDQATKRIEEHVFPLEDARAMAAYGMHSGINKILIINKEINKDRLNLLFINEKIGF